VNPAAKGHTCRRGWSQAKQQALRWLNIMAEASLYFTLFLSEDDYESYLHGRGLLEQLAKEVLRGGGA